jgi:hypothetical protein
MELEEEIDRMRSEMLCVEARKAECDALEGMQMELQELRKRLEHVLGENGILAEQLKVRDRECEDIEKKFRESNARLTEAFDKNQRLISILDEEIERSADEFKKKTLSSLKSGEPTIASANVSRKLAPTLERVAAVEHSGGVIPTTVERSANQVAFLSPLDTSDAVVQLQKERRESGGGHGRWDTSPNGIPRPAKIAEVKREIEQIGGGQGSRPRQLNEIGNNVEVRQSRQAGAYGQ